MVEVSSLPGGGRVYRPIGMPRGHAGSFAVAVEHGRIARIDNVSAQPAHSIMLPPLADLHVHASRAFSIGEVLPASLEQAIEMSVTTFMNHRAADYARHAERLFAAAFRHGTTRIRTHADVSQHIRLDAVTGTLLAAARFSAALDVEVVAFAASDVDPVDPEARALLRDAMGQGARLLGAALDYYRDTRASIDALLDLAVETGAPLDVHLDEHLDAERSASGHLAAATIARGLGGTVTLSHGCAIGVLDDVRRQRVIEQLARAGVTVIALPSTNLFLQDRGTGSPSRRGLAPARQLLAAGVPVRLASDNVRDAFFPYGKADLIEIAQLGAVAGHLDDPRQIVAAICAGREQVRVGDEASFVLVPGAVFAELLCAPAEGRVIVRDGVLLDCHATAMPR